MFWLSSGFGYDNDVTGLDYDDGIRTKEGYHGTHSVLLRYCDDDDV